MAHLVEQMAYTNQVPWHGLGRYLDPETPFEDWLEAAGLTYTVRVSDVYYDIGDGQRDHIVPSRRVLYRDDSNSPLGIVSNRYRIVQPRTVMEFFRSLCDGDDASVPLATMETAGVLHSGRRVWALARLSDSLASELGVLPEEERMTPYLLLTTSYDGTMATVAQLTYVRVVCNNTLTASLQASIAATERECDTRVVVPHNRQFDIHSVRSRMGLTEATLRSNLQTMLRTIQRLAAKPLSDKALRDLYARVAPSEGVAEKLYALAHDAPGQRTGFARSASGRVTAWGALNAVTYYEDHVRRSRTADGRMANAMHSRVKRTALAYLSTTLPEAA